MSEASLESQRSLSDSQEEVPNDMDKSVSQSESFPDDTHMTEIHINDSSSAKNLIHESNGEEDEGHPDVVMQNCSSNDRVHTVTEENSDPKSANPETSQNLKVVMADEACRSPAAELSVSSNGDSGGDVFQRDMSHNQPSGPITSHVHCAPDHGVMTEGAVAVGPYTGQKSQLSSSSSPSSPTEASSPVAASRLSRSISDSQVERETGSVKEQANSGAVVLADDMKNPAIEKLELVRKWSINTYKCTKQILSEKLGRGSRTVDLELEARIDVLRENKRKYEQVVKLAQTLANQLALMMQTQRQLGDAFADLSLKTPELHEEFGYNAETQKLLSKNGETLLGAINFFIASVNTLVDKTIEDTMINVKQYETARIEYDAYRTDLEELNLGPRDATTLPKIEQSQIQFQIYREKYEKMRNDVSTKLKFLEENKVKVLHNQLILFHNAIAAYFAGNQQHLEQTLRQFHIKLKMPGADTPSWLEEHRV
ncbi:arfaptin-1 isoform X1 [Neoarius graeffei]|uniref:arfaptin-1 isoform X1 n=2 Tax=Neoarius graeffei TaxID=443677 RepID=UPI00298C2B38|nr:arfaptin-1 isoform X1 [Neoarius graeffei]XP_060773282.1 arfaptin-1 isoform X1 [Neoarius graeffei]XP_060773283.1 arfaptin-1 isoform X1 [Neoarius graeffei]XP_060773284.1 arfaptin-1 isoform X1 [Neoarius graeffei]XP_060773285.1 arfaptin-1 isoform X1 [Neoarius graeffei]